MLLKSAKLAPEENHAKYMQLGQLAEGKEAIEYYKRGIQVLISEHQSLQKHKVLNSKTFSSYLRRETLKKSNS